MGKNQHQKDRMHITSIEWRRDFGGFKNKNPCRVLPLAFDCCAISLRPFKTPVCSIDGNVFDLSYRPGKSPVTGKKLTKNELFDIKIEKNKNGKFHCPLTYKVFNEHSYIVAIRTSGNVFSYEAVNKLNIKPKFWQDVLTGEKFTRKDIVTLQNPHKLELRTIGNFDHIKWNKKIANEDELETISKNSAVRGTLEKISTTKGNTEKTSGKKDGFIFTGKRLPKTKSSKADATQLSTSKKQKLSSNTSTLFTTFQTAASFTSTSLAPSCKTEMRPLKDSERRQRLYRLLSAREQCFATVQMDTSLGSMTFRLDVKRAPMTSHNFLLLSSRGFYDATKLHRLVMSFMVQGGDPEGSGFGGECAFGGKMKDEFHSALKHRGRGVLSMANSGPDSNGSQFFITFGECSHLDGKHSVFGHLAEGMDTLNRIELVKTDHSTDEPIEEIVIKKIKVVENPFTQLQTNNSPEQLPTPKDGVDFEADFSKSSGGFGKVGRFLPSKLNWE